MILTKSVRLALIAGSMASTASAADVLVVDTAGPFSTIQSAVLAATAQDVILVSAGTYEEDVAVVGGGRTIVARQDCVILGSIEFRDVPGDEETLLAGLDVRRPSPSPVLTAPRGAVHLVHCEGPVRVVGCSLRGASSQYRPRMFSVAQGGPGLMADGCEDVALIDSTMRGGQGAPTVGPPGGMGGNGVRWSSTRRATVMRCLVYGGRGGQGDDGGDGGHGIEVLGATTLHLDYSLARGGDGLDPEPFMPFSGGSGGHGLVFGQQTVWDFQSIFVGGGFGMGAPGWPDGAPGSGVVSGAPTRPLSGHPSRLEIPLIVRAGESYERRVSGVAGEAVAFELSDRAGFGFSARRRQPRLIGAPTISSTVPSGVIVSATQFGAFIEDVMAPTLAPGADVEIRWSSALCLDGVGGERRTSARPLIVLRAGL